MLNTKFMKRKFANIVASLILLLLTSFCGIESVNGSVIVKIDSVTATAPGTQIVVPVRVKNFQNIVSAQGTIEYNPTIVSFSSITIYGLPGMNSGNFGLSMVNNGKLTFTWYDANLNAQSLADSSVLFALKFDVIGSAGQQSAISFTNNPTPIEFIDASYNAVSVTSVSGKVVIPGTIPVTSLKLFADTTSGLSGSQIILPVRVKQFSQMVSAQGTITFNPAVISFNSIENIGLPGMLSSDFGLSQTSSGKVMFSWSDATLNGVTLADSSVLFAIKFTLMGNSGDYSTVGFSGNPVALEFINTSLATVPVTTQSGKIIITSTPVPVNLTLRIDSVNGVNGGQVEIPVRVKNFISMISAQGTIQFDPAIASFISVQQFGVNGMDANSFGTSQVTSGKLSFSWYDQTLLGQSLADSAILFTIKFNLIGSPGSQTNLSFVNSPVALEFIHSSYANINANLVSGNIKLFGLITLSTGTISGSPFCSGQNLNVPYITSGTMAAGNLFTAQLSDTSGLFSNPIAIGSLTATASGSISATLPGNLIPGTHYKIRVISSNPAIIGSDNGSYFTIGTLPTKPITPVGSSLLCQNNANTDYSTSGSQYATSYIWTILPVSAGTISGNSNSATVDWNNTFTGTAKICVKGVNNCGTGTPSDTLSITLNPLPLKPATPSGTTTLCQNASNTSYSSAGSLYSSTYEWSINPASAGVISGNGTTISVDWNDLFSGTAKISVKGTNNCGSSIASDSLTITLNPLPAKPGTPTGSTVLCENNTNTSCSTTGSTFASSYIWSITPALAGSVSGSGTTASIDWNNTFSGSVKISVKGTNTCGTGVSSDSLSVTLNPLPLKPATPAGTSPVCQGTATSGVSTTGSTNATAFVWSIYPSTAGTISGTTASATINWNAAFSGTAKIAVKGQNSCGMSVASDSLSIVITPLPLKPSTPAGSTVLCENSSNTSYSTAGSINVSSYIWSIYPASAGTISGSATSAIVDWNNAFTGIVKISVIGMNSCGNSISSDSLTVNINALPAKPGTPTGSTVLCENNTNTSYSTTGSTFASSYIWSITPASAGSVSGSGTTASIDWNNTFSGSVKISVKGTNTCGTGVSSDSLSVTLNPLPLKPATPAGTSPVCQGTATSGVSTTGSTNATAFVWSIYPSTAGTISGTTASATINWNAAFLGTTKIAVKGQNSCGMSVASDSLSIVITPLPLKPSTPAGSTVLCENSSNTSYSTAGSINASSYIWSIYPASAGTISGSATSAIVDWNNSFTGIVKISVIGMNSCGNSISSDSLTVNINALPAKPGTPTGSTVLCENNTNTSYSTTGSTFASSYIWSITPASAGSVSGSGTTATIDWNNTFSGSVKISVKGTNTCGTGVSSDSLSVTLNPLPLKPATPAGASPVCQGTVTSGVNTTGSTNATAFVWSIYPSTAGTISGTTASATINWNVAFSGTAKIAVKGQNNCDMSVASDSLSIVITPLPLKPSTPTGSTVLCENSSNTSYSTAGSTNASSYIWSIYPASAGTISGSATSAIVDWNNSFTGIVKISVIGMNSCGNSISSDSLTVNINALPAKPGTPTGSTVLCENNTNTSYSTTGSTFASSYIWSITPASAGSVSGSGTTATIDWNNTFSGSVKISVKGTNTCGTGVSSDSLSVTLNPLPLKPATPAGTSPVCQGTATSGVSTTGSTNATAFVWSIYPSTAGTISGTTASATINWNAAFSGTAKIAVKGQNSCGMSIASDSLSIVITPLPLKPSTPAGSTVLCENSSNTSYSTAGSINASSYIWSIYPASAGTISGSATSAIVDWNNSFTGVAKISVIGMNSCGNSISSDSLTVNINALPAKPGTPTGSTVLCENNTNTSYSTTGSTFASSYIWSITPASAGSVSGSGTTASINWNNTFSGSVKISVKGTNTCGTGVSSDSLSVTLNPLPLKPATPAGTSPVCQGTASSMVTTSGSTNATAFVWSIYPSTAGTISGTTASATINWNAAFSGTAKIAVKGQNSCGTGISSDSLDIVISPMPLMPATPTGLTSLCENSPSTTYTTSGGLYATSYNWSIYPASAGTITGNSSSVTVDWDNAFTGIAKISVIGSNSCGTSISSDSLVVTIQALPGQPTTPTGPASLSQNSPNSNYTTTGTNTTSYTWSITPLAAGTISGNTTSATVDWTNNFTGIVKISVIAQNSCGSSSSSDSLTVTITPLPTAEFLNTFDSICPGINDTLKIQLTGTAPWSVSYNNGITNLNINNITTSPYSLIVSPVTTTTYKLISVSDANWTNVANDSIKVVVRPFPVAHFTNTTNGMNVSFINGSTNASTYNWVFGDNSTNSTQINPNHTYSVTGTYTVILTATNQCGSDDFQDTIQVSNIGVEEVEIVENLNVYPNPAHQNVTIVFKSNMKIFTVQILNEIGQMMIEQKVYQSNDDEYINTFDVSQLPTGIYLIRLQNGIQSKTTKVLIQ